MTENNPPSVIIAGHSHIGALFWGVTEDGAVRLSPVDNHPGIFGLHGPWPRSTEYWDSLTRYATGNTIALVWEGNEHLADFLFDQHPRFDFLSKRLPSL